jgi:hypothetical protein
MLGAVRLSLVTLIVVFEKGYWSIRLVMLEGGQIMEKWDVFKIIGSTPKKLVKFKQHMLALPLI